MSNIIQFPVKKREDKKPPENAGNSRAQNTVQSPAIVQSPNIVKLQTIAPSKNTARNANNSTANKPKKNTIFSFLKYNYANLLRMAFNTVSSLIWMFLFMIFPIFKILWGLDMVFRIIMVFVDWNKPGAHPVLVLLMHFFTYVLVMGYLSRKPFMLKLKNK